MFTVGQQVTTSQSTREEMTTSLHNSPFCSKNVKERRISLPMGGWAGGCGGPKEKLGCGEEAGRCVLMALKEEGQNSMTCRGSGVHIVQPVLVLCSFFLLNTT